MQATATYIRVRTYIVFHFLKTNLNVVKAYRVLTAVPIARLPPGARPRNRAYDASAKSSTALTVLAWMGYCFLCAACALIIVTIARFSGSLISSYGHVDMVLKHSWRIS